MVSQLAAKELRALAPVWACAVLAAAGVALSGGRETLLGIAACAIGAAGIAALSFGHEFAHGTLGALLALPIPRARILVVKWATAGVLLVALAVVVMLAPTPPSRGGVQPLSRAIGALPPVLAAFCLAPAFTLLCRSTLAGMVLSLAAPALLFLAAEVVTRATYGFGAVLPPVAARFRVVFLTAGFAAICAAGLAATWPLVRRLQVIEGDVLHGVSSRRRGGAAVRERRIRPPLVALAAKELHLQAPLVAISAFFFVIALAIRWLGRDLAWETIVSAILTIHGALIALLAGALASAEERQMGTLDAQLLLPVRVSAQWTIKAAIALALALGLGLGLPLALDAMLDLGRALRQTVRFEGAVALCALAAGGLYVSTLVRGSVRALLMAMAAMAAAFASAAVLIALVTRPLADAIASLLVGYLAPMARQDAATLRAATSVLMRLAVAGLLAVPLRLALENHRVVDRGAARVLRHLLWMALAFTIVFGIVHGLRRAALQL
jgi:hypothetical protein